MKEDSLLKKIAKWILSIVIGIISLGIFRYFLGL